MESMQVTPNLNIRIVKSPNLLYQPLGEEAVILNMENEQYYGLDERGVHLWQLLDEYTEVSALMARILEEYEVDEDVLQRDLTVFLNDLQKAGLVTVEPL